MSTVRLQENDEIMQTSESESSSPDPLTKYKEENYTIAKTPIKIERAPVFVLKLYEIVNSSDISVACWSDEGETFTIKDRTTFECLILPQYFEHANFKSFSRQLNNYGFAKIYSKPLRTDDVDYLPSMSQNVYHHSFFKEGQKKLLNQIKKKTKKTSRRLSSTPIDTENVKTLNEKVGKLNDTIDEITHRFEARLEKIKQDIFGRIEMTSSDESNKDVGCFAKRSKNDNYGYVFPDDVLNGLRELEKDGDDIILLQGNENMTKYERYDCHEENNDDEVTKHLMLTHVPQDSKGIPTRTDPSSLSTKSSFVSQQSGNAIKSNNEQSTSPDMVSTDGSTASIELSSWDPAYVLESLPSVPDPFPSHSAHDMEDLEDVMDTFFDMNGDDGQKGFIIGL